MEAELGQRALFAVLFGATSMVGYQSTVAAPANILPPKPPNCADLSESKNLALPDGSFADVRIVQIGEAKLYIPSAWVRSRFRLGQPGDKVIISSSLVFVPEFHKVECPGVVHVLKLDQSGPAMTLWLGANRHPLPGIVPGGTLSMLHVTADMSNPPGSLKVVYGRLHHLPKLTPVPGIVVYRDTNTKVRSTELQNAAVEDLFQWLALQPNRRDNNRIFSFGDANP